MILAGDVGGTKTNLALFSFVDERLSVQAERSFRSSDYPSLDALVREFLASAVGNVSRACLGIPCAVNQGRCATPNLPWVIDAAHLRDSLQVNEVSLINDVESAAYGISALKAHEFAVLSEGEADPNGNCALLAAGTGLGEAILFWNGDRHVPTASEGGHADFAPRDELEIELLRYLQARYGHVSRERVLSGAGLVNIYSFMRDTGRGPESPWLADQLQQGGDNAAVISGAALSHSCELCVKALDLFTSIYGAEAGNLALTAKATGGVYLGGGIAPKIVNALRQGSFMRAFVEKGRLAPLLANVPVKVLLNEKAPLYGAAQYAVVVGKRGKTTSLDCEQAFAATPRG